MSKETVRRKTTMADRFNDDEHNRRRPCHQLIEKEKQRRISSINDLRKSQLNILQEILFNQRNVYKGVSNNRTAPNTNSPKARPVSAKNFNSSDRNRSGEGMTEYPNAADQSTRVSRSTRQDSQQQRRMTRSQSRPITNVSLKSDKSNSYPSSDQFKKLLVRLSSEMNHLESLTGFSSNRNDLISSSSGTTLAAALIGLVGHVKQYASNSKEIQHLKDELSVVIKTQLDFQQKIENQITVLQTMMQTISQVVNNEMISNRRPQRDRTYSETSEVHQNWLNNAQRPYLIEKDTSNAMDELLIFTRRMNNASPIDLTRQSAYIESLEASKKLIRPTSVVSTNGNNIPKQTQQNRTVGHTGRRSFMLSPKGMPLFESISSNGKSSTSVLQIGDPSASVAPASPTETILEKILQERLRLVQQMTELNKQHEMTQEELAILKAKTVQPCET